MSEDIGDGAAPAMSHKTSSHLLNWTAINTLAPTSELGPLELSPLMLCGA